MPPSGMPSNNEPAQDYWAAARRPLTSLAFLVPLLCVYEIGVVLLSDKSAGSVRNGADYWMRDWLTAVGFSNGWLLPAIVLAALLCWHLWAKDPWQVRPVTLLGMSAESIVFASALVALGQVHNAVFDQLPGVKELAINSPTGSRVVAFIGAGVYEEVLFRLCLLPVVYGFFRALDFPRRSSAALAILMTSLIFAMAHYVGPAADQFSMFSFSFRALAGAFFATLFYVRGFGVTVGSHAAYDVFVGVLFVSTAA